MKSLETALLVIAAAILTAGAQNPSNVINATGINAGVCVHVGVTDGVLEVGLAQAGKFVVHGLALDATTVKATRERIGQAKLYGLASVEKATSLPRLPYSDNLINLLVVDKDALGALAPSQTEILRVVAPFGATYVKSGGVWTTTPKALPSGMDEWTHYSHNAEGTCFSNDTELKPTNAVKWIGGPATVKRMRMDWNLRVLLSGGKWFHDSKTMSPDYDGPSRLLCRDAFNGVALWDTLREPLGKGMPWQTVAGDGKLFTILGRTGKPVAIDAVTGALVRTFANGMPNTYKAYTNNACQTQLAYANGKLFQTSENKLLALDAASGNLAWQFTESDPTNFLFLPTVDTKEGRIFLLVHKSGEFNGWDRWPDIQAKKIICLDANDGKLMWTNTNVDWDTTGNFRAPNVTLHFDVGQLLYENGILIAFGGHGLSRQNAGFNWARMTIDVATGTTITPPRISTYVVGSPTPYSAILRSGKLFGGSGSLLRYDARTLEPDGGTGKDVDGGLSVVANMVENQRCGRTHGAGNYVIFGFNSFFDTRTDNFTYTSITSTRCAETGVPGYGMLYHSPTGCGCIPGALVGHMALYNNPNPSTPVADASRLEVGNGQASTVSTQVSLGIQSDIMLDWSSNNFAGNDASMDAGGGKTLVARIHQHRIDAVVGGQVQWSFTAGSRISKAPVVSGERAYFGSHDGWVYCVNLSNGALQWRFMAAPEDRKIGAYGQLESAWPVYGVALINGKIVATAGRNPETDGGIYAYGLDPANGSIAWKKRIYITHILTKGVSNKHYANKIMNSVPGGSGDQVSITGISFNTATAGDIELKLTSAQPVSVSQKPGIAPPSSYKLTSVEVFSDRFRLPSSGFASVKVFDMNGRLLEKPFEGIARQGVTRFQLRNTGRTSVASGYRIIRLYALGEIDEYAIVGP